MAPEPPVMVRHNPLKHYPPLAKVHHSWPMPGPYGVTAGAYDGVWEDYVRITGSFPIMLVDLETEEDAKVTKLQLQNGARVLDTAGAEREAAGLPPVSVAVNYSPWYWSSPFWRHPTGAACGPARRACADPTVVSVNGTNLEALEASFQAGLWDKLKGLLAEVNGARPKRAPLEVGAVLIDSEMFWFGKGLDPVGNDSAPWRAAVDRKHEVVYNATARAMPGVSQQWYGLGSGGTRYGNCYDSTGCPGADGWTAGSNRFTGNERFGKLAAYTPSLYTLPEIEYQREVYRRTAARAVERDVEAVNPWICLGCGYRRSARAMVQHAGSTAGGGQDWTYDGQWDFDRVYSWMAGAELNRPYYAAPDHVEKYAPYDMAKVVLIYPSIFQTSPQQLPRGNGSTHMMQHFLAYLQGVALNATVNPQPDGLYPGDNLYPPYAPKDDCGSRPVA